MALTIVTSGYTWAALLVIFLAVAKPEQGFSLGNLWEARLATALGIGVFIVAMLVWASLFPATSPATLLP